MKRASWRPLTAVIILLATVAAFIYYFDSHPSVGQQLKHTSIGLLGLLLSLYFATIVALALTTLSSLRVCHIKLGKQESLLLTAYTAMVNFFGPLQSGPAFRGVYLKKKHGMRVKDYTLVTLLYLGFWGLFSCLFLLSGVLGWWLVPLGLLGAVVMYAMGQSRVVNRRLQRLDKRAVLYLGAATFLQASLVGLIYYSELKSVAPSIHFSQAIIYTGAANLALYVSLTPGAIGFRESFLLFSQRLHHVDSSTIVAASLIDRSVYILFLLLLVIGIFGSHANRRLRPGVGQQSDE